MKMPGLSAVAPPLPMSPMTRAALAVAKATGTGGTAFSCELTSWEHESELRAAHVQFSTSVSASTQAQSLQYCMPLSSGSSHGHAPPATLEGLQHVYEMLSQMPWADSAAEDRQELCDGASALPELVLTPKADSHVAGVNRMARPEVVEPAAAEPATARTNVTRAAAAADIALAAVCTDGDARKGRTVMGGPTVPSTNSTVGHVGASSTAEQAAGGALLGTPLVLVPRDSTYRL